jgi:hypothetical protein
MAEAVLRIHTGPSGRTDSSPSPVTTWCSAWTLSAQRSPHTTTAMTTITTTAMNMFRSGSFGMTGDESPACFLQGPRSHMQQPVVAARALPIHTQELLYATRPDLIHRSDVVGRGRRILGRGALLGPSYHPTIRESDRPLRQGLGTAPLGAHHVRIVLTPRIVPDVARIQFAPVG